jgi:hypothetical protein
MEAGSNIYLEHGKNSALLIVLNSLILVDMLSKKYTNIEWLEYSEQFKLTYLSLDISSLISIYDLSYFLLLNTIAIIIPGFCCMSFKNYILVSCFTFTVSNSVSDNSSKSNSLRHYK